MRADFWGECAEYDALGEAMLHHQVLIPPMKLDELREAIGKQAQATGLRFETGLLGTILDDVEDRPGAMPLVQHALLELWNRRHGRWLKHEEYQAIGCVRGRSPRRPMRSTPSPRRRTSRPDAGYLPAADPAGRRGEAIRTTAQHRQRAFLDELTPAGGDPADTKALVKRLGDARLVVTGADSDPSGRGGSGARGIDPPLADFAGVAGRGPRGTAFAGGNYRFRRQWDGEARDKSLLVWRGARLEDAFRLAGRPRSAMNQRERDYLNACSKTQERTRRSRRVALVVLGAGMAVVVAGLLIGYSAKSTVKRKRNAAMPRRNRV